MQAAQDGLGQVDAQAHFAELDPTVVVDPRLVDLEEGLVPVLRSHVRGVWLARYVVNALGHDARIVPINLTSPDRFGKHAGVVTEHVADAQYVTPLMEVHEEAE
jgi:hypothetical protein